MFKVVVHIFIVYHIICMLSEQIRSSVLLMVQLKIDRCAQRVKVGSTVKVTSSAVSQMAWMQSSGPLQ